MKHCGPVNTKTKTGSILTLGLVAVFVGVVIMGSFVSYALVRGKYVTAQLHSDVFHEMTEGASLLVQQHVNNLIAAQSNVPDQLSGTIETGLLNGTSWAAVIRKHATQANVYQVSVACAYANLHQVNQHIYHMNQSRSIAPRAAAYGYFGFPALGNVAISGNDVGLDGSPGDPLNHARAVRVKTGTVAFSSGSGLLAGSGQPLAHVIDSARVVTDDPRTYPTTPLELLRLTAYPGNALVFNAYDACWRA